MVGDILRRERERQKLTIKDIEKATSIRGLYLEAIENSENDKLPGEVYTKGFIKNYANFLGLDGESLVRQYREEVAPGSTAPTEIKVESGSDQSAAQPSETKSEEAPAVKPTPSARTPISDGGNRNSMMAAAAVLLCAIVGGLYYYFSNVEGGELASAPKDATQQVETAVPTEAQPSAATSVASAAASPDGVSLEAKFNDRCWTKVIVDGIVAFEGTAEQGESLTWTATNQIDITAGNAGAIEFVENGVNLGVAGAVGDVIEKTFVRQ